MDKRQELIIRRMLQQGGLSKNQELTLRRAIAGEIDPSDAIDSANIQFLKPRKSFDELVAEKRNISPEEEIKFDRKTGIKDTKLRSALGAAENKEEEESILYKFGLTKSDFVRDKRGNLALTPDGATKFGVKTDRNIVIDEEGFSRYDFSRFDRYSSRI